MSESPSLSDDVSGFVLIGGKSRRLGTDKAAFPLSGTPAAEHVGRILASVCSGGVALVGRESFESASFPVHPDLVPDGGPLAGVLTCLDLCRSGRALIVATDLWGLSPIVLQQLLDAPCWIGKAAQGVDVVHAVPAAASSNEPPAQSQPLCAVWNVASALPIVRRAWETGVRSMFAVMAHLQTCPVEVDPRDMSNINDEADLRAYLGEPPHDRYIR